MPRFQFIINVAFVSVVGTRLYRKTYNVVVFPFALHIAVQGAFKPLYVRLLLYDHEPSRASFALCWKIPLPASEEYVSELSSPGHVSSSVSYHLDLSSVGDPTGSNVIALWVA